MDKDIIDFPPKQYLYVANIMIFKVLQILIISVCLIIFYVVFSKIEMY